MVGDVFVGRHRELQQISTALGEVMARGAGQVVVVEGPPGIGKTALIDRFLELVPPDATSYVGAASELTRDIPFAPLLDAFREMRRNDSRLRRVEDLVTERDEASFAGEGLLRYRIVEAIVEAIEALTSEAPVVLVVEDLHWCDEGTAATLARISRSLAHLQVLLLCTTRPEIRAQRAGLFDSLTAGSTLVTLRPLPQEAVIEIARAMVAAEPGRNLVDTIACAAGNPLFVRNLLSVLIESGGVTPSVGGVDLTGIELAPSLRLTVLRRLGYLPQTTTRLLRVAAVFGTGFDLRELALLADQPTVAVIAELEPAISAGIIDASADRARFTHDLLRDALYDDIPASVRRALHAEAARVLADAGYAPTHLAEHIVRGGVVGNTDHVDTLRAAGREAMGHSPQVAVRLLDVAQNLAGADYLSRDALELEHVEAVVLNRDPSRAEEITRRLLRRRLPAGVEVGVRLSRMGALQLLSRIDVGDIEELEQAARSERFDRGQRARLLAEAARGWAYLKRVERARQLADEAGLLACQVDDPIAQFLVSLTRAMATSSEDTDGRVDALGRAWETARQSHDRSLRIRQHEALYQYAAEALEVPHLRADAERLLRESVRAAGEAGVALVPALHTMLGACHEKAGDWDEAAAQYETAQAGALDIGNRLALRQAYTTRARLYAFRGDAGAARSMWDKAQHLLPSLEATPPYMVHAHAIVLEAEGRADDTLALLDEFLTSSPQGRRDDLLRWSCVDYVRIALRLGREAAARAVAEATAAADVPRAPYAPDPDIRCRLLIERDPALAEAAVANARSTEDARDIAQTCEDAGGILADVGRSRSGVALLAEALERWESLGAASASSRVAATLRRHGIRRGSRAPRVRASSGWSALTPTEQRVVALVLEGLLYREIADKLFVSRRTVETHVASVFRKLGVGSRRQLVATAERRGTDQLIERP